MPAGRFRLTILFWLVTSYIVGSLCYTVLTWWWTVFIWLAAAAVAAALIVAKNRGKLPSFARIFRRKNGVGADEKY